MGNLKMDKKKAWEYINLVMDQYLKDTGKKTYKTDSGFWLIKIVQNTLVNGVKVEDME